MSKKYCDFIDELSADELYEGLLGYGLFAERIPPIFTSVPFYEYCQSLSETFTAGWNDYISFRVTRNTNIPRLMGIPTPMKYQRLCAVLRDYWNEIRKHFHTNTDEQGYRISRIHVRKISNNKRVFEMNYKNWYIDGNPEADLLIHDKGVSRFLVRADISTFFPSIYTHSIPWALIGKEKAKQALKSDVWYNKIDKACSDVRNGETHGLLIGPHASNLLSEIILTAVDKELYKLGYRFIRNIDDYSCYVDTYERAHQFLRDLEENLREYDLMLNHKKTEIINLPIGLEKSWKHQLSVLPLTDSSGVVGYSQVNAYIDMAIKLSLESGDLAIINYAIKKLSNLPLYESGKKLAGKRFLHLAVLYPYLLQLMEEYVFTPFGLEKEEIKKFADRVYFDAAKTNDFQSLCFSIYYSIKYGFVLDEFENNYDKALNDIITSRDCLTLVFTWIYFMKQNHWNRKASQVKPLNRLAMELKMTEMDRYWLFCYEALSFGSLSGEWRKMKQAGISFIRNEIMDDYRNTDFKIN